MSLVAHVPIWDGREVFAAEHTVMHPVGGEAKWCTSPRAGGRFGLNESGASALCERLTNRQKANLSYWIHRHNLEHRLFDAQPPGEKPIVVDRAWVVNNRDRTPPASDRLLMLLRELIRCDDAGEQPSENLQMAADSCRDDGDLRKLSAYADEKGWLDDTFRAMGDPQGGITCRHVSTLKRCLARSAVAVRRLWRCGLTTV